MLINNIGTSTRYIRDGIESYLLVSETDCNARTLTASIVEMGPDGFQHRHAHGAEQCYFIIEGSGIMTVSDESRRVVPGDCIFIPSNHVHGITNEGPGVLRYFSAASPTFGKDKEKDLWPLPPSD